ncbi:MAG TPA: hypothetical protein DCP32_12335 [Anaerolineaceae bacterium]|nr:MAG: hypothetical protein A2X24_11930 [Chloroflexi bacterium GWB2_54_36]HAL17495.1 hypothetical protein [Anaerolineaceae bacterium]HBA91442.1 hypothetical protein [Anaerolineaceae bacterium]
MRKQRLAVLITFLALLGSLVYIGINREEARIDIPNSKDSQEVQDIILHSYTVYQEALRNGGDVSEFDNVFINTTDYHYENQDVRDFVSLVLGPEIANIGGYLTVMKAKYIAYGCAVRSFKVVEQAAMKEDRTVTPEEIKSIQENCYGVLPPRIIEGAPSKLVFGKINIDEDRAVARYDDGAALLEAILVQENGRWLIAKIEPIKIHY